MPDITMCSGKDCKVKESCLRFTSLPCDRQSFFPSPPFIVENNRFRCEYYWGENADNIFKQLNDIVKPI